jgi:hypothetical protein
MHAIDQEQHLAALLGQLAEDLGDLVGRDRARRGRPVSRVSREDHPGARAIEAQQVRLDQHEDRIALPEIALVPALVQLPERLIDPLGGGVGPEQRLDLDVLEPRLAERGSEECGDVVGVLEGIWGRTTVIAPPRSEQFRAGTVA